MKKKVLLIAIILISALLFMMPLPIPTIYVTRKIYNISSYIVFSIVIIIWGIHSYFRLSKQSVQKLYIIQTLVLLFWFTIRIIKMITPNDPHFFWYLYYIAFLYSPVLFLMATFKSTSDDSYPTSIKIAVIISTILLLLVLTNDIHQQVFRFPHHISSNRDHYEYGWIYYAIVCWIGVCFTSSFILLGTHFKKAYHYGSYFGPIIVLLSGLVYTICYVLKVPFIINNELTFSVTVGIMFVWELCIQSGLLYSNNHYIQLFEHSSIPLWLLNNQLQEVKRSSTASIIPIEVISSLLNKQTISLGYHVYENNVIHGGYVVYRSNQSTLFKLQQQNEEIQHQLKKRYDLLNDEATHKMQLYSLSSRKELLQTLSLAIAHKLEEIDRLADELNDTNDKQCLTAIKLAIGYCKRLGNIVLSSAKDNSIPLSLLGLMLEESSLDVRSERWHCSIFYRDVGIVSGTNAIAIFAFFQFIIENCLSLANTSAYVHLSQKNNLTSLTIIFDSEPMIDVDDFIMDTHCTNQCRQANLVVNYHLEEGSIICTVLAKEDCYE